MKSKAQQDEQAAQCYDNVSVTRFEYIPDELKRLPQWVLYKRENRNGNTTKIPYTISGDKARSDDPLTWATFEACVSALSDNGCFDGIGFEFSETACVTGIDLDNCRNPDTGVLSKEASEIVNRFNSYTEVSQSGKGIHIFVKGHVPGKRKRSGTVEMYDSGRFFIMTGARLNGTPLTIEPRQDVLGTFYNKVFGTEDTICPGTLRPTPSALDDAQLLEKAGKANNGDTFRRLYYEGDITGYNSPSEADLALNSMLARLTQGDINRMDSLFRNSKLYREKWEREDYRTMTLTKACEGLLEERDSYVNNNGLCNYTVQNGCLTYVKTTKKNQEIEIAPIRLCNFSAHFERETVYDDGIEQRTHYKINGELADGTSLCTLDVPAEKFKSMDWVSQWGSRAIVDVGPYIKDHVRAAIQYLSFERNYKRTSVYSHIGWRTINGQWVYLHAGGGIGANGVIKGVYVDLGDTRLHYYELPEPPEGDALKECVSAVIDIIDAAETWNHITERLVYPDIAKVFRAPLNELLPSEANDYLSGLTGMRKTALAALWQSFYGSGFNESTLPGNWFSTDNALERLAFLVKDALFTIDDFVPKGASLDVQRMHYKADRVMRGHANKTGRQRMKQDRSLATEYYSRSLIATTGEDAPTGQSLRGRMLIREVHAGDIDLKWLSEAQERACEGVFASVMSGYLKWLATQMAQLKRDDTIRREQQKIRDEFESKLRNGGSKGIHPRTPSILAEYYIGFVYFVKFAQEIGTISKDRALDLQKVCKSVLLDIAYDQIGFIRSEEPTTQFISLIQAALTAGLIHVCSVEGCDIHPEKDLEMWGWRSEHDAKGRCVGFIDDNELYLDPDVSFAVAQDMARRQGSLIPLSKDTLWKRMVEKGVITRTDRGRTKVQKRIAGRKQYLLCVNPALIIGEIDS